MELGYVTFKSSAENKELLVFSLDQEGNYKLFSGDDSWFDYNYITETSQGKVSRSNPAAWVEALKHDYANSGLIVETTGFEKFAAATLTSISEMNPENNLEETKKEFQNASDFQASEEESVSLEEAQRQSALIEKSLKRSKRIKRILIGAILVLVVAAASVYAFQQIFKEPGPTASVFLLESSQALAQGLSGNGEFNLSLLLAGDGKISTATIQGEQTIEYEGVFFPNKLKLTPISNLNTVTEDGPKNNNLLTAQAEEIIWAKNNLYIKTGKGWLGTRLQTSFNLLDNIKSLNNNIPNNKKQAGLSQAEARSIASVFTVRQAYAGPVLGETPTWELNTKIQPSEIEISGNQAENNLFDLKELFSDFSLDFVSEQKSMRPRILDFTLSGDPGKWIPALGSLVTFKSASVQLKIEFSRWGNARPIVIPKKVRWISAKKLEELSTPSNEEIPGGITPEMLQQAFMNQAQSPNNPGTTLPEAASLPGVPTQ